MYSLTEVLSRHHELIVTVRGRDFHLWLLYDGAVMARCGNEHWRFEGKDLDDLLDIFENYRQGDWSYYGGRYNNPSLAA